MEVGANIKEQYAVIEHIGRGGMADVWSARDQRLQRLVAIKTIARGLSADIDPVARFEVEAQTIAQMEHPHILPIYDFGDHDSSLFIVMRYMPGGSLEDVLENGPMPVNETLRMGQAIAQALDYAHEKKVIHLDLKPPNILLDSSQVPYLADFGLATVLDPEGRARNPGSGTLLYMAPEQLVAETIDHRADIYSFCIMLFHMLTGQLPFEGTAPMALRQIQQQDELPDIEEFNPDFPYQLTDLLRRGTAIDPEERPTTHQEIIDEMREMLQGQTSSTWSQTTLTDPYGFSVETGQLADTQILLNTIDAEVLEAVELYSRARHAWAGGQGRFLLSLTHFMLISDAYRKADTHGLEIDDSGYQVLLRGALEYDYHLDHWWQHLTDESRRWVCLHAVRSGTAPTRIRALHYLETLNDTEPPTIPKLVGQALEVETDEAAQLAAIRVLGTRAKLMRNSVELKSEYRNRLLTTITRVSLELTPPDAWRAHVYSQEIDGLLARTALDEDNPDTVTEQAARTIGRIRSLAAVRQLAEAQRQKQPRALRALARVRDEAPALPNDVSPQARVYAWLTNTSVRLLKNPLDGIARWLLMLLLAWLAFGEYVYTTFRSEDLFTPQRWANTIAIGLVMALFASLLLLVSDEANRRLRGFWPWWGRLLASGSLGFLLGILMYGAYAWLFTGGGQIPWDLMRFGSLGLFVGFVIPAMLGLTGWRAIPIVMVATLLPLVAAQHNQYHQNFLCYYYEASVYNCDAFPAFSFTLAPLFGLLGGILTGWLIKRPQSITEIVAHLPQRAHIVIGALLALAWALVSWHTIANFYEQQSITWDGVSLLAGVSFLFGVVTTFSLQPAGRLAYLGVALVAFLPLYNLLDGYMQLAPVLPQRGANYINGLLPFDTITQTLPIAMPMVFVLALGAHGLTLLRGWWEFIGKAKKRHERGGWASSLLAYTLFSSGLLSLLALFSLHVEAAWALGWSLWGFLTFVFALATWRWARWGARGLLVMGVLFVAGGFLVDLRQMLLSAADGVFPHLWAGPSLASTLASSLVLVVGLYGVLRRQLWGALTLLALLVIWFGLALFSPAQESIALLTAIHLGLLAYALAPLWPEMEPDRFAMPELPVRRWLAKLQPTPGTHPTPQPQPAPAGVGMPAAQPTAQVQLAPMTEVDLQGAALAEPVAQTLTEVDPQAADVPAMPPIKIDTRNMRTKSDAPAPETEQEPGANVRAIKLDTSGLRSKSTSSKADDPQLAPTEPKAQPKPITMKLDVSGLRSKPSAAHEDTDDAPAKPDLRTEADPQAINPQPGDTPKPITMKLDVSGLRSKPSAAHEDTDDAPAKPDLRTEADPQAANAPQRDSKPQLPPIKLDMSGLRSKPSAQQPDDTSDTPAKPDLRTEADPQAANAPQRDSKPQLPPIKLDTSGLRRKSEADANDDADDD